MDKIKDILHKVSSRDIDTSQESILQLGMLLDLSKKSILLENIKLDDYSAYLPEELLNIRLTECEQENIVNVLMSVIENRRFDEFSSSIIWAIGKAFPTELIINSLITFLENKLESLNDETLYQAIIAIDNYFITLAEDFYRNETIVYRLSQILSKLQIKTCDRLKEHSTRLLNKIDKKLF